MDNSLNEKLNTLPSEEKTTKSIGMKYFFGDSNITITSLVNYIKKIYRKYFKTKKHSIVAISNIINLIIISNEHFENKKIKIIGEFDECKQNSALESAKCILKSCRNTLDNSINELCSKIIILFSPEDLEFAFFIFYISLCITLKELDQSKSNQDKFYIDKLRTILPYILINLNKTGRMSDHSERIVKIFNMLMSEHFYHDCYCLSTLIKDQNNALKNVFVSSAGSMKYYKPAIFYIEKDEIKYLERLIGDAYHQYYYGM